MCMVCHPGHDGDHMQGTEYCEDCHPHWHANGGAGAAAKVTGTCLVWHNADRPEVHAAHGGDRRGLRTPARAAAATETSLITKHAITQRDPPLRPVRPVPRQSRRPWPAAIMDGDATCDACHDAVPGHGYSAEQHLGSPGDMAGTWTMALLPAQMHAGELVNPPYDFNFACTACHSADLAVEHGKASSVPVNAKVCDDCHPTPRDTIVATAWDKMCATAGCHTVAGQEPHATPATLADHAVAAS